MRISAKQYALALYESVCDKEDEDIKKVSKNFVQLLIKNNDIIKINRIIYFFEKIWNESKGIVEAEVLSAKEPSEDNINTIKDYIKENAGAKEVLIKEKVDKKILGGFVVKYGDTILDAGFKRQIENLIKEMRK